MHNECSFRAQCRWTKDVQNRGQNNIYWISMIFSSAMYIWWMFVAPPTFFLFVLDMWTFPVNLQDSHGLLGHYSHTVTQHLRIPSGICPLWPLAAIFYCANHYAVSISPVWIQSSFRFWNRLILSLLALWHCFILVIPQVPPKRLWGDCPVFHLGHVHATLLTLTGSLFSKLAVLNQGFSLELHL